MIAGLAPVVPDSLAAMTAKMAIGATPAPGPSWRDDDAFEAVLARFGRPYHRPDRRALASLWSQYYLAALIIPTTVALICLDRILPVAADEVGVDFGDDGQVAQLWVHDSGRPYDRRDGLRFERLLQGHLEPFVACCARRTGLAPRVLWSNAATILAYAVEEIAAGHTVVADACEDARALVAGRCDIAALSRCCRASDAGCGMRAVCCLRYRLPGLPRCAGICPLARN